MWNSEMFQNSVCGSWFNFEIELFNSYSITQIIPLNFSTSQSVLNNGLLYSSTEVVK